MPPPFAGRFAQADTVVPAGVQGLDRYAYANNNSLKHTDPTGHAICDEEGNCYDHGNKVPGFKAGLLSEKYSGFLVIASVLPITLYARGGKEPGTLPYFRADEFVKGADGMIQPIDESTPIGASSYNSLGKLVKNVAEGEIYKIPAGTEMGNLKTVADPKEVGHYLTGPAVPFSSRKALDKAYQSL